VPLDKTALAPLKGAVNVTVIDTAQRITTQVFDRYPERSRAPSSGVNGGQDSRSNYETVWYSHTPA
jgi:hypothetical protein